eukprot:scaffold260565_cov32-Tisochrysis_lutea.AAC.2
MRIEVSEAHHRSGGNKIWPPSVDAFVTESDETTAVTPGMSALSSAWLDRALARSIRGSGRSAFFSHGGSVNALITTERRHAPVAPNEPLPPTRTAALSAWTICLAAAAVFRERSTGGRQRSGVPSVTAAQAVPLRGEMTTTVLGRMAARALAVAKPIPLVPPVRRMYSEGALGTDVSTGRCQDGLGMGSRPAPGPKTS